MSKIRAKYKSHKICSPPICLMMKYLYQEIPLLESPTMAKKQPLSHSIGRAVRFAECDSESEIPSHRDFTDIEHRSMWYTEDDYCIFALNEVRHKLTLPIDQQKEKHKQTMRIDNVRRSVLKSQSDLLLRQKMDNTDDEYSEWLAEFVRRHSEQSAIEARQRGMENDLEVLRIKMQEMTCKLTQRPALFRTKIEAVKASNKTTNNKNARWGTLPKNIGPPCRVERSSSLGKSLRADLVCSDKNKKKVTRIQKE